MNLAAITIDRRGKERGGQAPWKLPRRLKKYWKNRMQRELLASSPTFVDFAAIHRNRHNVRIHYTPAIGWTLSINRKLGG